MPAPTPAADSSAPSLQTPSPSPAAPPRPPQPQPGVRVAPRQPSPPSEANPGEATAEPREHAFLSAKSNPFLQFTTVNTRQAVTPPAALVDGVMAILKGRDMASITQHFRDMEESLDERCGSLPELNAFYC